MAKKKTRKMTLVTSVISDIPVIGSAQLGDRSVNNLLEVSNQFGNPVWHEHQRRVSISKKDGVTVL